MNPEEDLRIDDNNGTKTVVPLAQRRERRDTAGQAQFISRIDELMQFEALKRMRVNKDKKDKNAGTTKGKDFYAIDAIVGHRFIGERAKNKIELEVKWEGYEETTWERFEDFVQDASKEVEKYLVRFIVTPGLKIKTVAE